LDGGDANLGSPRRAAVDAVISGVCPVNTLSISQLPHREQTSRSRQSRTGTSISHLADAGVLYTMETPWCPLQVEPRVLVLSTYAYHAFINQRQRQQI
jgi:hypothetical protein